MFKTIISCLLIGLLMSATKSCKETDTSNLWPYGPADKVVVYLYATDKMRADHIIHKDALHKTVVDSVTLSQDQALKVSKLLTKIGDSEYLAKCFSPHHGIVYYRGDKVVAHNSVCFYCEGIHFYSDYVNYVSQAPDVFPSQSEEKEIRKNMEKLSDYLKKELKLPVFKSLEGYRDIRNNIQLK